MVEFVFGNKFVSSSSVIILLMMKVIVVMSGYRFGVANGVSMNYYVMSCPMADIIVQNTIAFPRLFRSGAHTLGVARCSSFKSRLSEADPTLDSDFARTLSKTCSAGDTAEQPFDATRNDFDNVYFNGLVRKNGVLTSDQTLYASPRTRSIVNAYAFNQAMFFLDFQQAFIKMGLLDLKQVNTQ
ncbi:hypothetical protein G4B88_015376 [Cannabis sativa]|uniref:peroxidase n=1 Tax=Cannabis sativa TaxID=3483 RepID=A0A7J6ECM2_CANSA|nr:hypothetical protein G4B88_015376 [Cannabis sativa]